MKPLRLFTALLILAALSPISSVRAGSILSGLLTNASPTWNRVKDTVPGTVPACGVSASPSYNTGVPYKVFAIRTPAIEPLTLDTVAAATNVDTFVALYCAPFNPATPLANLVFSDDDGGGYPNPRIAAADNVLLAAGTTYYLVVTGYSNYAPHGSFSLSLGGSVQEVLYTVTSSISAGSGTVVCTSPVSYGDTATCSITPSEYFLVSNVVVDGVPKGALTTVSFANVTSNHTVAVTFAMDTAHRARISRPVPVYYSTLTDAYHNAANGETVQSWGVEFVENLSLLDAKTITIEGGYNAAYTATTGMTGVKGTLSILGGKAILEGLEIR